ncbi:hypothetical protein lbkm_1215 [Lachnospiraceae bacterium KM106-2]|nr:hypothetical protein lbkm_1215 [Lachnospiraceae bacterium KM106-2]
MEKLRKYALRLQIIVFAIAVLFTVLTFTKIVNYQICLVAIILCIFVSIFNMFVCIKGLSSNKKK